MSASLDELLSVFPAQQRAALLAEFQALDTPCNDELIRLLRAVGIFTAMQYQVPDRIRAILEETASSDNLRAVMREELKIGDVERLHGAISKIREIVDRFTSKTINVVDSSAVAARLDKFRANSFRAVAIAAVAGVILCLLGFGFGIYLHFRQQADKQLERMLANDIPQQRVVMDALLRRGVTMQLYNTHNPWTKADCQAVVFGGPVGSVFTDEEGHGVVLLPK